MQIEQYTPHIKILSNTDEELDGLIFVEFHTLHAAPKYGSEILVLSNCQAHVTVSIEERVPGIRLSLRVCLVDLPTQIHE